MELITTPREIDEPFDHGSVVKFAAMVWPNTEYGFQAYNYDGEVVFLDTIEEATEVFDKTVKDMQNLATKYEAEGPDEEYESFTAIIQTDKGLMVMGVATLDSGCGLSDVRPDAVEMPHLCWARVLLDVFGEESDD